jgi:hypothetical protein
MDKLINLTDYQSSRHNLTSSNLGYFKKPEQQLRLMVIELLEAFVTLEPTESQIVKLEAQLKVYLAKHANSNFGRGNSC